MNDLRFLDDTGREWIATETWIGVGARAEGGALPPPIPHVTFKCPASSEELRTTASQSIWTMGEEELRALLSQAMEDRTRYAGGNRYGRS